jgi:hypothetical protein
MRRRVLLICGLSLVLVGVFGAGYTVRDLARNHRGAIARVEHGALDWDRSGGRPTRAGADLPRAHRRPP